MTAPPTKIGSKDIMLNKIERRERDIPLIDLGRSQCRFAVRDDPSVPGGYRFCAAPTVSDRVYCDHHHALAISVQPRRTGSAFNRVARRAA